MIGPDMDKENPTGESKGSSQLDVSRVLTEKKTESEDNVERSGAQSKSEESVLQAAVPEEGNAVTIGSTRVITEQMGSSEELPDFLVILPPQNFKDNNQEIKDIWEFLFNMRSAGADVSLTLDVLKQAQSSEYPCDFVYKPMHARNEAHNRLGFFRRAPIPKCKVYYKMFMSLKEKSHKELQNALVVGDVKPLLRQITELWVFKPPAYIHVIPEKNFVSDMQASLKHWRACRSSDTIRICSERTVRTKEFKKKYSIKLQRQTLGWAPVGLYKRVEIKDLNEYYPVKKFHMLSLRKEGELFASACKGIGLLSYKKADGSVAKRSWKTRVGLDFNKVNLGPGARVAHAREFLRSIQETGAADPHCFPPPFSVPEVYVGSRYFSAFETNTPIILGTAPMEKRITSQNVAFAIYTYKRKSRGLSLTALFPSPVGLLKAGLDIERRWSEEAASMYNATFKSDAAIQSVNARPLRRAPHKVVKLRSQMEELFGGSCREDTTNSVRFIVTGDKFVGKSSFSTSVEGAMYGYLFHDAKTYIAGTDRQINTVHPQLRVNNNGLEGTWRTFALPLPLPHHDPFIGHMCIVDTKQSDIGDVESEKVLVDWTMASDLAYAHNYIFLVIKGTELIEQEEVTIRENAAYLKRLNEKFHGSSCPPVSILVSHTDLMNFSQKETIQVAEARLAKAIKNGLALQKIPKSLVRHIHFITNRTFDKRQREKWQTHFDEARDTNTSAERRKELVKAWTERNEEILHPIEQAMTSLQMLVAEQT